MRRRSKSKNKHELLINPAYKRIIYDRILIWQKPIIVRLMDIVWLRLIVRSMNPTQKRLIKKLIVCTRRAGFQASRQVGAARASRPLCFHRPSLVRGNV